MINKFLLIFLITFSTTIIFAQKSMDGLFQKYGDQKYVTTVNVSQDMFALFADIDEQESQEFTQLASQINGIKILKVDKEQGEDRQAGANQRKATISKIKADVNSSFNLSSFTELMSMHDKAGETKIYVKKNGNMITDFLFLSYDADKANIISIVGNIDLKNLIKFSQKIGIDGLEGIEKIAE